MTLTDVLRLAPLGTAGIWLFLAGILLVRRRYGTWSEAFFLGIFLCGGLYALFDVVYFHAPTEDAARLAAHVGLTALSLAGAFIFLYGRVLRTRMRTRLVLAALPMLAFLPFFGNLFIVDLVPLAGTGAPYEPVYRQPDFIVWILLLLTYVLWGLVDVARVAREVRPASPRLARRLDAIVLLFLLVVLLGTGTNVVIGLFDIPVVPPFSTLLAIPGAGTILLLQQGAATRVVDAVRRRRAPAYRIALAFLTYQGGIPIATRARSGSKDPDVLGANLDVILRFIEGKERGTRTRLPSTLSHGGTTIAIAYGRWSYLALVLEGEPDEILVSDMRQRLEAFEGANADALADWNGDMSRLSGAEGPVDAFFESPDQA